MNAQVAEPKFSEEGSHKYGKAMVSASEDTVCGKRGSEDPTVGVLLSPSAFRQGSVNLEAKNGKGGSIWDRTLLHIAKPY